MKPKYGMGMARYGLASSVVNVLKTTTPQTNADGQIVNKCEKSPSFAESVVLMYTDQKDTILELCGGTGSFSKHAVHHGRSAVYVEQDKKQADSFRRWINSMPSLQRDAFLRSYRFPADQCLPLCFAPTANGATENTYGYIPWPRLTHDEAQFSDLSKQKYADILVRSTRFS